MDQMLVAGIALVAFMAFGAGLYVAHAEYESRKVPRDDYEPTETGVEAERSWPHSRRPF